MRISPFEYALGHPSGLVCSTDTYYANLATKLFDATRRTAAGDFLGQDGRIELALRLAQYVEDIVADLGIWRSFVEQHSALYGKPLPFYATDDDYSPDLPHLEDVQLLMWMTYSDVHSDTLFSPLTPPLMACARVLFPIIDQAFDRAPENSTYLNHLHQGVFLDDFLKTRDILEFYFGRCYLTRGNYTDEYLSTEIATAESFFHQEMEEWHVSDPIYYMAQCTAIFSYKVGPLAMTPQQWLTQLLRSNDNADGARRIEALRYLPLSLFSIVTYDFDTITLKSPDDELIVMDKHSFDDNINAAVRANDTYLGSAVCFDDTWYANGLSAWIMGKGVYKELREEHLARKRQRDYDFRRLVKRLEGRQVFYFASFDQCVAFFAHLGLHPWDSLDEEDMTGNVVAFINPATANTSLTRNIAEYVKDDNNPYYDPTQASMAGTAIITSTDATADELIHYLIDHDMLPDIRFPSPEAYQSENRAIMQHNLDFLARAMRHDAY